MQDFSTVTFFLYLKRLLIDHDTWPFRDEDIIINNDAYAELGDEQWSRRRPFAVVGVPFSTSDRDVRFVFEFSHTGLSVLIPNLFAPVDISYDEIDDDEKVAAEKLAGVLIGLANGQLSYLMSVDENSGSIYALELLHRSDNNEKHRVISCISFFTNKSRSHKDGAQLTTNYDSNRADIPYVEIDTELAVILLMGGAPAGLIAREEIDSLDRPLSAEEWDVAVDKNAEELAERTVEKFDAWTRYDSESMRGKSFFARYAYFARARHTNLLLLSVLALLTIGLVFGWSHVSVIAITLVGFIGVGLISVRGKLSHVSIDALKVTSGYGAGLYVLYVAQAMDSSILSTVVAVVIAIEILECLVFDVYYSTHPRS